jgi:hypothetical protein
MMAVGLALQNERTNERTPWEVDDSSCKYQPRKHFIGGGWLDSMKYSAGSGRLGRDIINICK